MNERIKELAKQVYVTGEPWKNKDEPEYLWFNFREDTLEKFAKLIVNECYNRAEEQYRHSDDEWDKGVMAVMNSIDELLGVEE